MNTLEILGIVFGSGVLVAVINQVGNYIFGRRKRKDYIEDKNDKKNEIENTQIKELRESTDKQFKDVREDIVTLNTTVSTLSATVGTVVTQTNAMMKSQKAQAYDRIRCLGLTYIKTGMISPEELKGLTEMYEAYSQLPGADGFLIKLMDEVNSLRIKIN